MMCPKMKYLVFITALLTYCGIALSDDLPCAARAGDVGQGCICVCNSTYCDTVENPTKLDQGLYYLYKTSNSTPGFTKSSGGFFRTGPFSAYDVKFTINSSMVYQTIEGFGAAATDTSGLTIKYLPVEAQEKLIESYFGPTGIEYNFLRLPIGGTDFSPRIYTLDDVSYDEDLTYFSLTDEDYNLKIPLIKNATNVSQRGIKIIGCTWLAPAWMKNNNTHSAQYISNEHYEVWARYHVRFLQEYEKEGISVWGITGGNEIMMMMMIPEQNILNLTLASAINQRAWLRDNLKPLLIANNFTDVKFITLEDERLFIAYWLERFASDPEAMSYLDGIALHTYSDKYLPSTVLDVINELYPSVGIYYTETSINTGWGTDAVVLGSWDRAEIYLSSIFDTLNHWSRTFMDWNLALDVNGGPSMTYDIDAAVIINQTSAEFYKQPIFYAMGHFSKFVPPGSKRVQVIATENESFTKNKKNDVTEPSKESLLEYIESLKSSERYYKQQSLSVTEEIQCIAFVNTDGSYTAIILNTEDEAVTVKLEDSRVGSVTMEIEEHSLYSFVYWPEDD